MVCLIFDYICTDFELLLFGMLTNLNCNGVQPFDAFRLWVRVPLGHKFC